ncbi:MAG: histidine kinase [Bacteroidetes bacterium]|nr:histidine kinase [Bacteroidota bacterium]MBS1757345.1 histidine kinase [Bacteroidota bacterium]
MKQHKIIYHFIFWICIYLLWILVFHRYSVTITKTMTIEFCYLLFVTADFYAINNFIVPSFLIKKKYVLFAIATLLIIAISAWLRALVALQMNRDFFHTAPVDFNILLINSFFNIAIWVLLVTVFKMLMERIQTQKKIEALEKDQMQSELDYLKAQINPHTLFNSLNTVYGHIDKNNKAARNILLQYSELLKYQLYECGAERVDIVKEIAYIKNYISFQQLRKTEELTVNFQAEAILPGLSIAPLLIVVPIENAFKFVSCCTDKENKIDIKIYTSGNIFHCIVTNTKEPLPLNNDAKTGGIGISNLKRRLALLYPYKHTLTITNRSGYYETNLMIDLA